MGDAYLTLRDMHSLRRVSSLVVSFAVAALLAACDQRPATSFQTAQGGAAETPLAPIKLQLNWVAEPEFGGFFCAREKALYQGEGLDVDIVQGGPSVPAPQLVASGKVDLAIVSGTQVLELNEQGGDLVAIFAVYQHSPMGIMVHASSPHETLMQLWESDSVLSIEDGLADYQWLNRRFPGGKRRTVPYTANLAQFAQDPALASQCFVFSEPVSLELKGVKTRVFMMNESGFDPYNTVVVARRGYLEQNRDICAKFVRATALGWRAYLNDPKPTNQAMARLNPAMTLEAMDLACTAQLALIADDEAKRLGLGGMRYQRWDELANQMLEMGRIKKKPDPQTVYLWNAEAGTAR